MTRKLLLVSIALVGCWGLGCSTEVNGLFGPSSEGGAGGSSGEGASSAQGGASGVGGFNPAGVTVGAGTTVSSGNGPGPSTSNGPGPSTSNGPGPSTSSGPQGCDLGDCDACISCSTTTGTCVVAYDACFGPQANEDCYDFLVCADDCNGSDDCYAGCVEDHPQGVQLYSELVDCVICGDCSQSCDGAGSGC